METSNPNTAFVPAPPPTVYRQNVFVPAGATTARLLGTGLRTAKLVLGIVQTLAAVAGLVPRHRGFDRLRA